MKAIGENMKIGILTLYFNNKNYGGLLQAYALQHFLAKKGYECEQICWNFEDALLQYSDLDNIRKDMKVKPNSHSLFYRIEKKLLRGQIAKKRAARDECFKTFEVQIPHSKQVYTIDNYSQIAKEYDAVVVGSDQIWNMDWYCPEHFLSFSGSALKIAYAASMPNCELNDLQKKVVADHLESFSAVSVREKNTQQFFEEITQKKISWMPDPTLLLARDEWVDAMSATHGIGPESYIFCYFLGGGKTKRSSALRLARKTGRKIVTLPHLTDTRPEDLFFGDMKLYDVSPREFITLISNADLVMTDSFHATVFSIIFQKKFVVFSREENDKSNSRIGTLLREFGLEDHIVLENAGEETIKKIASREVMDESEKMNNLRNRAELFFTDIFGGTNFNHNED